MTPGRKVMKIIARKRWRRIRIRSPSLHRASRRLRILRRFQIAAGWRVRAAGIVLVRQMPGSAKGVVFITPNWDGNHREEFIPELNGGRPD
jgi:hypothetical protein